MDPMSIMSTTFSRGESNRKGLIAGPHAEGNSIHLSVLEQQYFAYILFLTTQKFDSAFGPTLPI